MNIHFEYTKVFLWNKKMLEDKNVRLIVNRGGTRSSKTYSIMQLLVIYALSKPGVKIAVIGETSNKIKITTLESFKNIMKDLWHTGSLVEHPFPLFRFSNGSFIRFLSADKDTKVMGVENDITYLDEIQTIKESIYIQLASRTNHKLICSFNPTSEFYITEELNKRKNAVEFVSTYLDNPKISQTLIEEIEYRASVDENYRRVMLLGEYGNIDGTIFQEDINWQLIDELPLEYEKVIYGMDFGYTNDPTTLLECRIIGQDVYIEEHIYEKGLLPRDIASKIKLYNVDNQLVIADSSLPAVIDELRKIYGVNVRGVKKWNGSVLDGINLMKVRNIFITKSSLETIKEFRYYQWGKKKDKHGNIQPKDNWNHTIDAIRYVIQTNFSKPERRKIKIR